MITYSFRSFGKKRAQRTNPEKQLPLREHLKELKNRLVIGMLAIVIAACCSWFLYDSVFETLQQPIKNISHTSQDLIHINFESIASSLDMRVKISFFLGLLLASPVWVYQMWAFIAPGLKRKEKQKSVLFFGAAVPCFALGVYCGWLVLPNLVRALIGFTPEGGSNIISANTYFDFVMRLLLILGGAFMAPMLMVAINAAGILTGKQLLKSWRVIVFVVFLIAAMVAPGSDVMTMFYLVIPMLVFYGLALGVCLLQDRRRRKKHGKSADFVVTPYEQLDTL